MFRFIKDVNINSNLVDWMIKKGDFQKCFYKV